jgi:hypothetical protein
MDCWRILSKLDWKALLRKLNKDELALFKLSYLEQNSIPEIASLLGRDNEKVAREVNKLKAKVRSRARAQVKGKPLEKDLIRLGFLPPEKVDKKRPPGSGKRAAVNKPSAGRAKGTRLEEVLASWGFRLKENDVEKESHASAMRATAKKKSTPASRKKHSRRRERKTETHP